LRISRDGKQSRYYPAERKSGAGFFSMHDDDNFYFFDLTHQAIMYWKPDEDIPRVFVHFPSTFNTLCNYFYVHHEKVYIAGGSNFLILDTLQHTMEDISAQYYDLKANLLHGTLSEDMHGITFVDDRLYMLGNKTLYSLRKIPPS